MRSILLAIALFAAYPILSEEAKPAQIDKKTEYQQTFLLPLEASQKNIYNLSISIPLGFKSLQAVDRFIKPQEMMIEYIPKNENSNNWSEIITVNKFIGKGIQAGQFTENLTKQLLANSKKGKILSKRAIFAISSKTGTI